MPGKTGRPTKFTPGRVERIVSLLAVAVPDEQAAQESGISPRTFYRWMKEGEAAAQALADAHAAGNPHRESKAVQAKREFLARVHVARAQAETTLVARVQHGARTGVIRTSRTTNTIVDGNIIETTTITEERDVPGDWRAAAWMLERRFPERWSRKDASNWGIGDEEVPQDPIGRLVIEDQAIREHVIQLRALIAKRQTEAEARDGATPSADGPSAPDEGDGEGTS